MATEAKNVVDGRRVEMHVQHGETPEKTFARRPC
jgi:hypothetical protein